MTPRQTALGRLLQRRREAAGYSRARIGELVGIKPGNGVPYPLFVYSGLLTWTYFASAASSGVSSLLSNGGLLDLTVATYYLPDGETIEPKRGIKPQVEAKDDPKTRRDEALPVALDTLLEKTRR